MPEPSSSKLYVGNIDYRLPIADIQILFARYGVVEDVFLPRPKDNAEGHVNRGFAFVTFSTQSSAEHAIEELHGSTEQLFKRRLVVQIAKTREPK